MLIKGIEKDTKMTRKAIHTILEKFSIALYYNDLSISRAFEAFDIDRDGIISTDEFIYGMS